jgi:hypothetical protein
MSLIPIIPITKDAKYSSRYLSLGRKTNVDSGRYSKFANWFNLDLQGKQESSHEVVSSFEKFADLSLSNNERSFLRGIIETLPESFRVVKLDANGNETLAFSYMNLLPLIGEAVSSFSSSENQKDKSDAVKVGSSLSTKLRDYYVNQQLDIMTTPENEQRLLGMSEDERRKLANDLVNASDEAPAFRGRSSIGGQGGAVDEAGAAQLSEFERIAVESGLSPQTFRPSTQTGQGGDLVDMDEWLQLNPESSVLDLAGLEKEGLVFSEGFNMGGILDPNGSFTVKDADGKPKSWTATEASRLIYNLREKGEVKKIEEIQDMMVKAGYYMDTRPIRGIVDETTVVAWNLFLTDAARSGESPKNQFLKKVSERQMIRTGDVFQSRQDPVEVDAFVQSAAQSVLGRPLTRDEVVSVKSAILDWEKQALTSGLLSTDPTRTNFDARVVDLIQTQNQEELRFKAWAEGKDAFETIFGS